MVDGLNLSWQLRVPGGTHPGQDALPSQGHTHHTHSDWDSVDPPAHLMHTFVMWEETESSEKPHSDMGIMCKLHTDSGLGQKYIYFFSSTLKRNNVECNDIT